MLQRIVNPVEFDSCAVFAAVLKSPGVSTRPLWIQALQALETMEHRAGWIDGASDGTGLLTEIPWHVWKHRGVGRSERPLLVSLALSMGEERMAQEVMQHLAQEGGLVYRGGWLDVADQDQGLWSFALLPRSGAEVHATDFLERLEERFPGQVAAFGDRLAAFKGRMASAELYAKAEKYWGAQFQPRLVVGHNRFSTNTATDLKRVQPFLRLAHNGEINTIERMRQELASLGVNPVASGSDSQSLDRAIAQLGGLWELSLAEVVRLLSPPSPAITRRWPSSWQAAWTRLEGLWQPVVQGPQGLIATDGRSLVAAVDALGLRPLWVLETAEAIILSSEPHVVGPERWVREPYMVGPGEVLAWSWEDAGDLQFEDGDTILERLVARTERLSGPTLWDPADARGKAGASASGRLAADGWTRDDLSFLKSIRETGQEPIGSLGFDGPLAALSDGVPTIADFLQETVAVVTNPALDRERESEHFRIDVRIGARPRHPNQSSGPAVTLPHPWLDEPDLIRLEQVFQSGMATLPLLWRQGTSELHAARDLAHKASLLVRQGTCVVVLDDHDAYQASETVALDPSLATGAVIAQWRKEGLLRHASLVVRSGMIRHLHDVATLLGLGAAAVFPYALWEQLGTNGRIDVLNHGLEKIMSTMGTHWLAGWGRNLSAIGLPWEYAEVLGVPTYAAPRLEDFERGRQELFHVRRKLVDENLAPRFIPRANPRIYKLLHQLVDGRLDRIGFHRAVRDLERQMPTQIRHLMRVPPGDGTRSGRASLAVGNHSYPLLISSMSFGSQGETVFRAYAEAAQRLNVLAMNGEGGEIPDMIGRYKPWRGYQIASGRFGVNAALLSGASYAEIKIGQGAKPGEGGHLPGKKVSPRVAEARRAQEGVDLISPSNNHDLYSIEDLKQLIDELKTVNPELKVVVKVPVVPNIGTIAVGIVKAGADVITLSGFDGGTGAARLHALRHVGLPADVGIPLVHQALLEGGVRDRVEIWADGGVRTADDVLKYILLGANRVGLGTMAMVALGCTICRQCQKDTCHVGITTQIESREEAQSRGLKRFEPQEGAVAVERLVRYFEALGEELSERLAQLGFARVEEAVGQWRCLRQWGAHERLDYLGWIESLTFGSAMLREVNGAEVMVEGAGNWTASTEPRTRLAGVALAGRRHSAPHRLTINGVAGQGFGAFLTEGLSLMALGGAQDGVAKGASGGRVWVMKHRGMGGHVGKSLAYGAQGGTIVVQGSADARAGVRLAGARIIIMGDGLPVPKEGQGWRSAAIKGFGFEYMTRGQGLVLADPGPWLASGMTGGVIYLYKDDAAGLTEAWLRSRLAQSARVSLTPVVEQDEASLRDLLGEAESALRHTEQHERADIIRRLAGDPLGHFLKVVPEVAQTDQEVSTE
ncbi:glutamate synthase-related protein [Sulfobacillus harzensis]|uniref:Glutamate synthase n=1 Tax=Sulfobacillus harzensis TaxID=2729629 RepID=A0A7Y0L5Q5_9FIRM|nr:glutamate synthase-related protein [Sulfobacillus harzensis]NMP22389.1 glutamate synthase [Sulfobacillus harzensis]